MRRFGFWPRIALGAVLVLSASAVASAATGFNWIEQIIPKNPLDPAPDQAFRGEPQTVLVIGSDTIGEGETEVGRQVARSDTLILVRLDPNRGATPVMSIPRDLKVNIPGYGVDKINAAYALGGADLTVKTVREAIGVPINHVVNVDLNGFTDVVDALGCVYVDVDRRYFNDSPEYTPIDLQPGYQKLCGLQALAYARYRHEDTDLVRGARQQEFLRALKAQNPPAKLVAESDALIQVFVDNTTSDIANAGDARRFLEIAVPAANNPIQEVHFNSTLGPTYVEASPEQMQQTTSEFLGAKTSIEPSPKAAGAARAKPARPGRGKAPKDEKQSALLDSTADGEAQAEQLRVAGVTFPVCYPTLLAAGSSYEGEPRVYRIGVGGTAGDSAGRERFDAYRMVVRGTDAGEYYGVQGTTWMDGAEDPANPPILAAPSDSKTVNGRTFDLYYDGDRLRTVAWRTSRGVYWLSNTLLQTLSAQEMLKIAGNTRCE